MRKYFGTDGIRRIANTELSPELVFKVAKAGGYVLSKHTDKVPTILIGRDTRISGTLIESAMNTGFLSYGANVYSLGVLPTPAVAYLTKKLNADAGVVISASHNTFEFNGIKYFSNKGMKIPDSIEEEIERVMDSGELNEIVAVGEKIGVVTPREDLSKEYISFIVSIFQGNLNKERLNNIKVAIDCANGATYKVADEIFSKLGISFEIINNNPNGININENCGSTHLNELKKYVVQNNFDLGIAYDGDGDRCLAIDENGNEIDGDMLLALISNELKKKNKLNKDTVVATVMSNLGLNKYCKNNDINLVQTSVGDRYVLEEMLDKGYNLGGEQSGHIIFLDYNPTGDGIVTSLMLLEVLSQTHESISNICNIINIYPQVLINAKVNNDKKFDFEKDEVIIQAIEEAKGKIADTGRILIRTSGTEPLVRVMIEGENIEEITKIAQDLANLIEERLK